MAQARNRAFAETVRRRHARTRTLARTACSTALPTRTSALARMGDSAQLCRGGDDRDRRDSKYDYADELVRGLRLRHDAALHIEECRRAQNIRHYHDSQGE